MVIVFNAFMCYLMCIIYSSRKIYEEINWIKNSSNSVKLYNSINMSKKNQLFVFSTTNEWKIQFSQCNTKKMKYLPIQSIPSRRFVNHM